MNLSDLQYDAYTTIIFQRLKEYAKISKDTHAVNLYKVVRKRLSRPKKRYELYRTKVSKRMNDEMNKQMLSDLIIKGMALTLTDFKGNTKIVL